jgi:predicted ferric reductase
VHTYWYLGRSAGFISYWLLLFIVLLGLAVRSRLFDGWISRGWVFEFHRFLSLLVLVAVLFHALIMLPDPYAHFSLRQVLLPFQSHLRNTPMALGIIAFYGTAFLTGSFYLRGLIGQRGWRLLHYLTFLVYCLSLAHALLNGTDSTSLAVRGSYYLSAAVVTFFVFYRLLATRHPLERPAGRAPSVAGSELR